MADDRARSRSASVRLSTRMRFKDSRSFVVEDGPRTISISANRRTVCVGLRDGRVAIFSADPDKVVAPKIVPRHAKMRAPVRAMCHVKDSWWIVAGPERLFGLLHINDDQSGQFVDVVRVEGDSSAIENDSEQPRMPTYVGCLEQPDPRHVVVSYARSSATSDGHCTRIYALKSGLPQHPPAFELAFETRIGRLRSVIRVSDDAEGEPRWLMIGFTGQLWLLGQSRGRFRDPEEVAITWGGDETVADESEDDWGPALVTDVAAIPGASETPRNDIVVSTDIGAFVVTIHADGRASSRRLDHAGLRGVPLGLASCTVTKAAGQRQAKAFIWCFDSLGGVHLYAAVLGPKQTTWNRVQSRVRDAPAVRALAYPLGPTSVVVWQNCRDETVAVARYELPASGGPEDDAERVDPINVCHTLSDAQEWLNKNYGNDSIGSQSLATDARLPKAFTCIARAPNPREEPEAVLADLFDPSPAHANTLWEFLADPTTHLAEAAIETICELEKNPAALDMRLRESVDLWAHTLVGSIHRLSPPFADDLALGVMRWLHRLSMWAKAASEIAPEASALRAGAATVAHATENALFDVRRWTLFGPQSSDPDRSDAAPPGGEHRPHRFRVSTQLSNYLAPGARGDSSGDETRRQLEARIGLESMLFKHRVDDEAWQEQTWRERRVRSVPYDVARLKLRDGRALCALLWRQELIRLVIVGKDGSLQGEQIIPLPGGSTRFGRAVVLWGGEDDEYRLLTSARFEDRKQKGEKLIAYAIRLDINSQLQPPEPLAFDKPGSLSLDKDTLTCLRLVRGQFVLMGVRRSSGAAEIELLEIGRDDLRRRSITLREARGSGIPNPVHSVHFVERGNLLRIVAGCEDGTVYLVEPVALTMEERTQTSRKVWQVASMAAPVWSIRCRELEGARLRVFAGTADGHIAAWQQLSSPPKSDLEQPAPGPLGAQTGASQTSELEWDDRAFACLWSTREAGAIVGLWAFEAYLDLPREAKTPVVLAVARNGRAVMFDDQEYVAPRPTDALSDTLNRPRVPGQRIERFKLRSTAFAAARIVVGKPAKETSPLAKPVARLLLITGGSVVRVVGLHQPKRSGMRKDAYKQLGERWLQIMDSAPRRSSPDQAIVLERRRLRYPEALRAAAPALRLLPISFFLLDRWRQCPPLLEIPAFWFPRYLRAHVKCMHAYRTVTGMLAGQIEFDQQSFNACRSALPLLLQTCLRDAHELGDKLLFQEITENVEKRFTAAILNVCKNRAHDARLLEVYPEILKTVEQACRRWLATDVEAYGHVQTVRIKNLVDGEVLHALAMHHQGRPELEKLIQTRVWHVQLLLLDGNPLVPLEALRAVNFSLIRACWFTVDADRGTWPGLKGFIDGIGAFAAQAASRADDALAHEIARVHALCIMLSPREGVRVALNMRLGRLPDEMVAQTRAQLAMLSELFSNVKGAGEVTRQRARAIRLFEHSLNCPPGYLTDPPSAEQTAAVAALEEEPGPGVPDAVLEDWKGWSTAYDPCLRALKRLKVVTRHLSESPELASFRDIEGSIDELKQTPAAVDHEKWAFFERDRTFMLEQLGNLVADCEKCGVPYSERSGAIPSSVRRQSEGEQPVAPAVVLASRAMQKWAQSARRQLGRSGVSEPQHAVYSRVLQDFEMVVAGLRSSSSVQRRLVTGVLGHHLMEALEEHVLNLFETAHVLYPRNLIAGSKPAGNGSGNNAPGGNLGRHADALMRQADQARAIPKNLRTVYQLLSKVNTQNDEELDVRTILEQAFRAEGVDTDRYLQARWKHSVKPDVAAALGLIFSEFATNHRVHGDLQGQVTVDFIQPSSFQIKLPLRKDEAEREKQRKIMRLVSVSLTQMQDFLLPAEGVVESSGVGLYLANLAASAVGWTLELAKAEEIRRTFSGLKEEERKKRWAEAETLLAPHNAIEFRISEVQP
jgi:hypothetical protein